MNSISQTPARIDSVDPSEDLLDEPLDRSADTALWCCSLCSSPSTAPSRD